MRALVYHGPGQKAWEEAPDPEITDEGDAIVRVDTTTICGTDLHILDGDVPELVHQQLAAALDACVREICAIQRQACELGDTARPQWPMLVLRTPTGWTGPKTVDGVQVEGTFRAHQVPIGDVRGNPAHLAALEEWLRSYRPAELFCPDGTLVPELAALPPRDHRRMSANPHANGGQLLRDLTLPDFATTPSPSSALVRS
jgi:xylulose-5-phosphate/fructose-6-phosphate phosphoketolase